MTALLSILFFAAIATASITTTVHIPSVWNKEIDFSLVGSVVAVDGDATTLMVKYDDRADCSSYQNNPEATWTFYGKTGFEDSGSTTDTDGLGPSTAHVKCNMPSSHLGSATCTYSNNGRFRVSVHCSWASRYATPDVETYTRSYYSDEDGPARIETQTSTYDRRSMYPEDFYEFCKTGSGGSVLPENVAISTGTFPYQMIGKLQVDITAGEEKLPATAGATPTNSEAKPTAEPTRPSSCDAPSRNSAGPVLPSTSAPASDAALIRAAVPALAGLAVAIAAFVA
jgi:hypothetical protein